MENLSQKQNLRKVCPVVTTGDQPLSKIKSASAVTDDGKLFLFGGFDEDDNLDSNVYILDTKTQTWETHRHKVYREGHSALYVPGTQKILVYGGVPEENDNYPLASVELLEYDLVTNKWSEALVTEDPAVTLPKQTSRHAACLSSDGTKMFISGGLHKDSLNSPYDDLYCYDIMTGLWDGPRSFVCRFGHTIVNYKDKIWSFGGLTNEMAHASEISWFDLRTNTTGSISIHNLPKLEGDHIYLKSNNDSIILDVLMPLWTYDKTVEPCIALYDMNNLRWQSVLAGSFKPLLGYRWRHTFIHNYSLYLLGYPSSKETEELDYRLSSMIQIDLSDLGIMGNNDSHRDSNFNNGSIVSDLSALLYQDKYSDFEIVGIEGNERCSLNATFIENNSQLDTPFSHDSRRADVFIKSKPIRVHKTILLARWPHFEKVIESGMVESQTNSLFIPEPVSWLQKLVEYLYTDQLKTRNMTIITGLLVFANLYEIPKLRLLCIEAIYSQGLKIKNVLKIWSSAKLVKEEVLAHNASTFCFYHWGKIVKTRQFRELSKDELITLCREVGQDGIIIQNKSNGKDGGTDGLMIDGIKTNLDNSKSMSPSRNLGTPNSYSGQSLARYEENDFVLNRYGSFRYSGGFNDFSTAPIFGLENFNVNAYQGNGYNGQLNLNSGYMKFDGNDDDDDDLDEDEFDSGVEDELNSMSSYRTRFTTPQASIFLTHPQSALNSLGERSNDDDENDDTDMEG